MSQKTSGCPFEEPFATKGGGREIALVRRKAADGSKGEERFGDGWLARRTDQSLRPLNGRLPRAT